MLTHGLTYTLTHSTCILSHLRTHSRTQTLWEDRAPQPTLESMERRGSETGRGRRLGPPDSPYGPGSTCPGPSGRVLPAPRPPPGSAGPHGPHVGGSVSVWGLSRDPRPRGRGLSLCPVLLPSWVLPQLQTLTLLCVALPAVGTALPLAGSWSKGAWSGQAQGG